jgi:hypothetical protein
MNSLYGKFGMNPIKEDFAIIKLEELDSYLANNVGSEVIQEAEGHAIVSTPRAWLLDTSLHNYFDQTDETRTARFRAGLVTKSNVAIASAITAYARIALTSHMMDPNNPVFYHDTDSIVLQHPLPSSAVGIELGQMKLEYTIEAGVFAGPKLYAIRTEEGKEIIRAKGYGARGITFKSLASLNEGVALVVDKEY